MVNIRQISLSDYFFKFSLDLPTLGKHLVHSTITQGGFLLGASTDPEAQHLVGIIAVRRSERPLIEYVFVEEAFRRQQIATKLIETATSLTKEEHCDAVFASVVLQNPFGDVLDHLLSKAGFGAFSSASIARFTTSDPNPHKEWDEFMKQRGGRICAGLARRGYHTLSFADADEKTISDLQIAVGKRFPSNLDPAKFLGNKEHRLVYDHSFITVKDGEPAAFVTATTLDDKSLTFQQLSAGFAYQGRGAFFLPLAAFIDKAISDQRYSMVSTTVSDNNSRMKVLLDGFLRPMAASVKTQNSYRKELHEAL
jgi:GNAT superfamily N-acetyltransferase